MGKRAGVSATASLGDVLDNPAFRQALLQINPDCVKLVTLDGRLEFMNDNGLHAMQIGDFGPLFGQDWAGLWPAESQATVRQSVACAARGERFRFEGFCPTAAGEPRWWDVSVAPILGEDGAPARILAASRDITDQRRLRQAATEQARFETMAKTLAGIAYWRVDAKTRKITWSDLMYQAFDLDPSIEPQMEHVMSGVPPQHRAAALQNMEQALLTGEGWNNRVTRIVRPSGEVRYLEGCATGERNAAGEVIAIFGTLIDITERKLAELAAAAADDRRRADAERAALAVEAAQVGIWEWDLVTGGLLWDERMFALYGLDLSQAPSLDYFEASLHPEDKDRVLRELDASLTGRLKFDTEFRILRADGALAHLRALGSFVKSERDGAVRMVGTNWDITSVRTLEASLRASEARIQNVVAHAHQAIVTLDGRGVVTTWNRHAELIFGWSAGEAIGQRLIQVVAPESAAGAAPSRQALLQALAQASQTNQRLELSAFRKHGETFPIEIALSKLSGPTGWEFTVLMQDISERRAKLELFENSFTHAPIGQALIGLDGRFLKVNQALCGILGHTEAQLLATDFQSITHADDLGQNLDLRDSLLAGERVSYQMDKRYLRSDGSCVWASLSVSIVLGAEGRPSYFVMQVQDLSARRDMEARYRLLAENASDMIALLDRDGKCLYMSPSSERVLGHPPEALVGQYGMDFTLEEDRAGLKAIRATLAQLPPGEAIQHRMRMLRKNGEIVWVERVERKAQRDDGEIVIVAASRDVTARVEQEVILARALEAAEAAGAAKSEFLANMSHEIRTPMTAIIGFSALLAGQDLDADSRGYVERVEKAGAALLSIVNDVLDFSKLESGQFDIFPEAISLREVAQDALMMFTPQADEKGLVLEFVLDGEIPDRVQADPNRLRQILLNLIGNAVKFTEAGHIRLRLAYDAARSQAHLAVEDTGRGLGEADQAKLFQRFSQVDGSSTRRHGGTGLGLAICRGLSEAMGGGVGVRSQPGQGSTFFFHIAAPPAAAPIGALDPTALDAIRVLVISAAPDHRQCVRSALELCGAEVTEAPDGQAGMQAAAQSPYDIILLDVSALDLDGQAMLELIRGADGPNAAIPVLALATVADKPDGPGGFNGVVPKPIEVTVLVEAVRQWTQWDAQAEPAALKA